MIYNEDLVNWLGKVTANQTWPMSSKDIQYKNHIVEILEQTTICGLPMEEGCNVINLYKSAKRKYHKEHENISDSIEIIKLRKPRSYLIGK